MAAVNTGHKRAQEIYTTLGPCEMCGRSPAEARHHRDGDTSNNSRENVAFLCRPCHGAVHRRTHCKRGHEFTPENTLVDRQGQRRCRACRLALLRAHYREGRDRTVTRPI